MIKTITKSPAKEGVPSAPLETIKAQAESTETQGTILSGHRLSQLDFLRGIAILLVLGAHQPVDSTHTNKLFLFAGLLGRFGWTGVELFFVLSGFLVGGLIFREVVTKHSFDARRFFVRRILKIWPMYYLYLAVVAAIVFMQDRAHFSHYFVTVMVPSIFNYQNLSPSFYNNIGKISPPMGMTWSLAIEEHFYFLLPLLCLFALALRPSVRALHLVAQLCAVCIAVCITLRFLLLWNKPWDFFTHLFPTYLRIDGLCFGVLLAYLYHVHPMIWDNLKKYRVPLLAISVLLLLPMVFLSHEKSRLVFTLGYTFLYLGFGGILVVLMQTTVGQGKIGSLLGSRLGRWVAAVGRSSYSIYLWSLLLAGKLVVYLVTLIPFRSDPTLLWLGGTGLGIALAITEGAVIARLIEVPTLLLRDRLFPARSEAIRAAGPS